MMAEDARPVGLDLLIFGEFKRGKSVLASTAPQPVLVLDVERGSRFTNHRHTVWDLAKHATPPVHDGTWDVCSVYIRSMKDVDLVYQWLNSGQHPFKTVIIDSISALQQLMIDDLYGVKQLEQREWGHIFRVFVSLTKKFQNLKIHPTAPIDALILIAMARVRDKEPMKHLVQGQFGDYLPYMVDVVGALAIVRRPDNTEVRRLFVEPHPQYAVGERVGGCLGPWIDEPNISDMITVVRKHMTAQEATGSAAG
jgi:hypothetical protein